ncbi:hypothetical protein [Microvirga pakistanensis]|uniref:hypothetical protein n=1 Tax=Microvirga pakistanensis TaxID=1682650 RepID=UPI00141B12DD|nr:hypothetical protein [Microvirga pakistanensis]
MHSYGALDGINGAGELGQKIIASGVCYAPAVLRNQLVHYFTMGSERAERPNLVLLHKPRVAHHVSREDGYKPPPELVLLPIHGSLNATQDGF